MSDPLLWNTLDEAAAWLGNETREQWNPKRIIDYSIKKYRDLNGEKKNGFYYKSEDGKRVRNNGTLLFSKENLAITLLPPSPTYLSIKFPEPRAAGLYRYQADTNKPIPSSHQLTPGALVRVFSCNVSFAPLYRKQLADLYLHGQADINQPSIEFLPKVGWEYTLFDPIKSLTHEEIEHLESYSRACHGYLPHDAIVELGASLAVTLNMVGVNGESLMKLLADYKDASNFPGQVEQIPPNYTTHELNVLEDARLKFWENHDPSVPPKKDEVVDWIVNQGVSQRIASAMDTILRSSSARKGGNKPVTFKSQ